MAPPPVTEPVIELSGIAKDFSGHRVLESVDLRLQTGEWVLLRGANGSGKSTLLKIAATLLKPSAGQLRLFNAPPTEVNHQRPSLGVLLTEPMFIPSFSCRDNLQFQAQLRGNTVSSELENLIDALSLRSVLDKPAGLLSHGFARRLELALTLMHRPRLLLLDEPLDGLDDDGVAALQSLLQERRRAGVSALIVTHQRQPFDSLIDRTATLSSGRIACD